MKIYTQNIVFDWSLISIVKSIFSLVPWIVSLVLRLLSEKVESFFLYVVLKTGIDEFKCVTVESTITYRFFIDIKTEIVLPTKNVYLVTLKTWKQPV